MPGVQYNSDNNSHLQMTSSELKLGHTHYYSTLPFPQYINIISKIVINMSQTVASSWLTDQPIGTSTYCNLQVSPAAI